MSEALVYERTLTPAGESVRCVGKVRLDDEVYRCPMFSAGHVVFDVTLYSFGRKPRPGSYKSQKRVFFCDEPYDLTITRRWHRDGKVYTSPPPRHIDEQEPE